MSWARLVAAVAVMLAGGCAVAGDPGREDETEFMALLTAPERSGDSAATAPPPPTDVRPVATSQAPDVDERVTLRDLLALARVEPESEHGSYDREAWRHWGPGEYDDGLNVRHEVLDAHSLCSTARSASRVLSGCWLSLYDDGYTESSGDLHIDHIVALAEAHQSGGWAWTAEEREVFANWAGNLLPVSAAVNEAKSAHDPAQWMPPDGSVHCSYLVHWMAVKVAWDLSLDAAEHAAVQDRFEDCADWGADLFLPVWTVAE